MTAAAFPETVVRINGRDVRFSFDPESWVQAMMRDQIAAGGYERGTWETVKSIVREGDTVIDVGAHVGVFSCLAAALVGETGSVHAFEPNTENFARLKAHKACNAFACIHAQEMAIGENASSVTFYDNLDNDGGHALWNPGAHPANDRTRREGSMLREVPQYPLDSVGFDDTTSVRLVKIDTEGAELRVLRGADALLDMWKPYVIAEINPFGLDQLGDSEAALIEFMTARSYAVLRIHDAPPFLRGYSPTKPEESVVYNVLFVPPGEPMPFTAPMITIDKGREVGKSEAPLRVIRSAPKSLRKIRTRAELPLILNDLCPGGYGVEVGVQHGHHAAHILQHWAKGVLFCVDPWREYGLASKEEMDALRYFATLPGLGDDIIAGHQLRVHSLGARLFAQSGGAYVDIANVSQDEQDAIYCAATRLLLPFSLAGRCQVWRMTGHEAAQLWKPLTLDFVYLDARHDYTSVINDLAAWTDRVKLGGIIAGHDYLDGEFTFENIPNAKPTVFGVKRAVDEWAKLMGWQVHVTTEDQFPTWYVRTPA